MSSNFILKLVSILIIIFFFILVSIKNIISNNTAFSNDFSFSLLNIITIFFFFFFTNNLFSFIFFLELTTISIFYMFTVSKHWYKNTNTQIFISRPFFEKLLPYQFINLLFFQYWITFFSSVFLFFSFIFIFHKFNTSNYFELNYYLTHIVQNNYSYRTSFIFFFLFLLGLLLKIGFTPFHLFKIEVYKGLPFVTLLCYNSVFFFVYVSYFFNLFVVYIPTILTIIHFPLFFVLVSSIIYVSVLLFDTSAVRSFFGYSTIITLLNLLILILL